MTVGKVAADTPQEIKPVPKSVELYHALGLEILFLLLTTLLNAEGLKYEV